MFDIPERGFPHESNYIHVFGSSWSSFPSWLHLENKKPSSAANPVANPPPASQARLPPNSVVPR